MAEATIRRRWVVVVAGVPVVVLAVLMSGLAGWNDLNSVHEDVDIATGRMRRSRYLFYVRISEKIEDSIITTALPPERVAAAEPEWHRVNTFCGFGRVSPHHVYHGAWGQMHQLEETQSTVQFTEDAKREVAETVLRLWQTEGSDFEAGEYIRAVLHTAMEYRLVGKGKMNEVDLPGERGEFDERP